MDQATQQNAAMVEETSAAARNLNAESEALAEKAGHFNVDDGARSAKTRTKTQSRATPIVGLQSSAIPAKARANGSGISNSAPAYANGNWESF
jgi:methyl-accepting chemotaxis protein